LYICNINKTKNDFKSLMQYSLKAILHTAFVVLTVTTAGTAMADNKIVPPAAHQAEHTDLIAGQLNIGNQIKVDATEKFLEDLFPRRRRTGKRYLHRRLEQQSGELL